MKPPAAQASRLVSLDDPVGWDAALSSLPHTWGHTWGHCRAMQAGSEEPTFLWSWSGPFGRLACPVVVRSWGGRLDVATPYGFSGPVARGDCSGWFEDWCDVAAEQGWVCAYLGLNPLLPDPAGLPPADVARVHEVYTLELAAGEDALLARMSQSRRRQLRRWADAGPRLTSDAGRLADFLARRSASFFHERSAGAAYAFAPETWSLLADLPGVLMRGVVEDGEVVAAFVFGRTATAADYLFGVTTRGREHLSAGVLWTGVQELCSQGVLILNLGGGVRPGDGVADFKLRFGPDVLPLQALRTVHRPQDYATMCSEAGVDPLDRHGYFPPYRRPHRG